MPKLYLVGRSAIRFLIMVSPKFMILTLQVSLLRVTDFQAPILAHFARGKLAYCHAGCMLLLRTICVWIKSLVERINANIAFLCRLPSLDQRISSSMKWNVQLA